MRDNTDTPFGFGSREWLGDAPGAFAADEPDPEHARTVDEHGDDDSGGDADE